MKIQGDSSYDYREERAKERYYEEKTRQNTMSKLIGKKVNYSGRNEIGVISFYNQFTGELDIEYANGETITAHISKCSCKGIEQ